MKPEIEPASAWDHKRDGYTVIIADDLAYDRVQMKDANDAQWQDAVGYLRDDDRETLYVRTEADFLAKFTRAEGLGDEESEGEK